MWHLKMVVSVSICPGRQFKEASRFANLVKSASAEVAEEEQKLAEEEEKVKEANDGLAQLSIDLSACHEQVAQLERKEGKASVGMKCHY